MSGRWALWPPDIASVLEQAVGVEPWLPFIAAQFGLAAPSKLIGNERGEETMGPPDKDTTAGLAASLRESLAVIGVTLDAPVSRRPSLETEPATTQAQLERP